MYPYFECLVGAGPGQVLGCTHTVPQTTGQISTGIRGKFSDNNKQYILIIYKWLNHDPLGIIIHTLFTIIIKLLGIVN